MVFYKVSRFEQSVKTTPNDCLAGQSWLLRVIQVLEHSPLLFLFIPSSAHPAFLSGLSLPISCSHSAPLAGYFLLNLCPGLFGFGFLSPCLVMAF